MTDTVLRQRHLLGLLLLVWLAGLLTACGFQPRGHAPSLAALPGPLYIAGLKPYSPLHRELTRQLTANGVTLVNDASTAGSTLAVRNHDSDRRVLSVDSRNRAVEYELEETLDYSLRVPGKGELIAEQRIRVTRIQFSPGEQVLSRDRERELILEDMRRDLGSRLIRRLASQLQ